MKIKKKTYENKKKTYENKRVFVIIHCKPNQLAICSTVLLFSDILNEFCKCTIELVQEC